MVDAPAGGEPKKRSHVVNLRRVGKAPPELVAERVPTRSSPSAIRKFRQIP